MPATHVLKAHGRTVTQIHRYAYDDFGVPCAYVEARGAIQPVWIALDALTIVPRAELLAGQVRFEVA